MAWPAGIGKIALPEGRGLEQLATGLVLARVKHVKLASRKWFLVSIHERAISLSSNLPEFQILKVVTSHKD